MIEITRVWERLYLGGRNDAENLYRANPRGITTVVSLCEEPILRHNSGVNYLHIPIEESMALARGTFDTIVDAIGENIRWGTVLLHCGSGMSRAPILAAAWMHVVGYKNIDEALQEIANIRPVVCPSGTLLTSVKSHLK
jgi:protein-tyrosine phosphatase